MTRLPKTASALAVALAIVSACDRVGDVTTPSLGVVATRPVALIGDNPHFSFLPPIAQRAPSRGELDASLSPVVEICEWSANACVLPLVSRLTDVRVQGEHYGVNWHTNGLALNPAKMYRLRVLVAGTELGSADVDVVKNGADARSVDASGYVALVAGRTLPIKFRIEQGAVSVLGTAGGSISALDGTVLLDIPSGALDGDVGFTFKETVGAPQPGGIVVDGSTIEFGPDGLVFDRRVELTLRYDDAGLSPEVEDKLRLHKLVGGAWVPVPGGSVDVNANTVTGMIGGFSTYGVVTWIGTMPVFEAFGTAVVDGVLSPGEWDPSASLSFIANLPNGDTTTATFYVMNDATNLYIAVRVRRNAADPFTGVSITFDNDGDAMSGVVIVENGDDLVQAAASLGFPLSFTDGWWENVPPCAAGFTCQRTDVASGGTEDGSAAFAHSCCSYSVFEIVHPLNSSDNLYDFSRSVGDTVGFSLLLNVMDASNNLGQTRFPDGIGGKVVIKNAGVDQQQLSMDATGPTLAIGSDSEQILTQVVTAGISGTLSEVRFPVSCATGALVVEIQGVTSGEPNGVVQASQTIPAASLPTFAADPTGFRKIVFSAPASVTTGNKFAIVLKNLTGSCGLLQGPVGDSYLGGEGFFDSRPNQAGVWVLLGQRHDLPFQTVVN